MVKKIKSKMDILKVFEILNSWKTIRQISDEIKLSYQPTYTYLKELNEQGFLNHKKEGNMHLYSLNLKNSRVVREISNNEFDKTHDFIENSNKKIKLALEEFIVHVQSNDVVRVVLLFGSTARKSRVEKSDVDIFAVGEDEKIKRFINTLNMKYNVKFSLVIVSLEEFRKMLVERNDFVQNLINEKIVLFGFEFFVNELIKSMEKLKWI